jgi:hypothetical protein
MRGWLLAGLILGVALLLAGVIGFVTFSPSVYGPLPDPLPQAKSSPATISSSAGDDAIRPEERLPETSPPPGLPITALGPRDLFPIIREPRYVSASDGDKLLAPWEPVLGLCVGLETRAYSTNQLNKHKMVLDVVGGTPVLVTY